MDTLEAPYTTRATRRVRPDPIPQDVQAAVLDAIRAPSGGDTQNWRFLLVDDPEVKGRVGPLYRDAITQLWASVYADRLAAAAAAPDDPASIQTVKVQRSAQWLADHFDDVPLYLFGFVQHDPTGGSTYSAVWSAVLAALAHGVGSSLTSVLGFFHPRETLEVLGGWIMACCVSFGYPTGRWGSPAGGPCTRCRPGSAGARRWAWRCPSPCGRPADERPRRRPPRAPSGSRRLQDGAGLLVARRGWVAHQHPAGTRRGTGRRRRVRGRWRAVNR